MIVPSAEETAVVDSAEAVTALVIAALAAQEWEAVVAAGSAAVPVDSARARAAVAAHRAWVARVAAVDLAVAVAAAVVVSVAAAAVAAVVAVVAVVAVEGGNES